MTFHEDVVGAMRMYIHNAVSLGIAASAQGLPFSMERLVHSTAARMVELAEEQIPLAKVMDGSDLVLHAEGLGVTNARPWLSSFSWVCRTADSNIRKLAAALFDMRGADGLGLARRLDPQLSGIAPGSLWIGIRLQREEEVCLAEMLDGPTLSDELHQLPSLVAYIGESGMSPGIEEIAPDPAMRDIALAALLRFAPSGRRGIHTLGLSTPTQKRALLGLRERLVLKQVLDKPSMAASREGSFVGEIRAADLDQTRLHLRGVPDIGTVRCVVRELGAEQASRLLGRRVRAVGHYQVDRSGRPRLMKVERFEEVPQNPAA